MKKIMILLTICVMVLSIPIITNASTGFVEAMADIQSSSSTIGDPHEVVSGFTDAIEQINSSEVKEIEATVTLYQNNLAQCTNSRTQYDTGSTWTSCSSNEYDSAEWETFSEAYAEYYPNEDNSSNPSYSTDSKKLTVSAY
ncbi:hypothetical protein [Pontibacillus sp. HMF3514]|uniref:hypothetical protein n=1 Tax=Pontibacillus sp. HMF3514 TaxID=2692425 RepID=UPI00131F80DA|nr:hypothetical protein [Pontibacillus sp. HMF3514]QHE52833.1 hypothetical protein GS400_12730 [Pontibacillus sp. HMF3514]